MSKIDYQKHDKGISYYDSQLKIAHGHGFCFITAAMHELYEADFSLRQVGRMLGFSMTAVKTRLVAMGVKLKPLGGRNNAKLSEKQAREILTSTLPGKYYTEKLGISLTTVRDIRNRKSWKGLEA